MAALEHMEPSGPTYLAALERGLRRSKGKIQPRRSVADKQAALLAHLRASGHEITER